MNWLDLVIIIMLGVLAYAGYKQGIIKSVFSVAILLVSFLAASILSPIIYGRLISNEEFMVSFTSIIEEKLNIQAYLDESIALDTPDVGNLQEELKGTDVELAENPGSISQKQIDDIMKILEEKLNLPPSVMKKAKKQLEKQITTNIKGQVVTQVSDVIARSVVQMIIQGVCFTGLYLLLFFLLKAAADMFDIISRFPVIKEVNKIAGAGLGLVEGILVLWIVGTLLFSLVNAFGWKELGELMKGSLFMKIL